MEWRLEPSYFEMILAFIRATNYHGAPTGCEPGPGLQDGAGRRTGHRRPEWRAALGAVEHGTGAFLPLGGVGVVVREGCQTAQLRLRGSGSKSPSDNRDDEHFMSPHSVLSWSSQETCYHYPIYR